MPQHLPFLLRELRFLRENSARSLDTIIQDAQHHHRAWTADQIEALRREYQSVATPEQNHPYSREYRLFYRGLLSNPGTHAQTLAEIFNSIPPGHQDNFLQALLDNPYLEMIHLDPQAVQAFYRTLSSTSLRVIMNSPFAENFQHAVAGDPSEETDIAREWTFREYRDTLADELNSDEPWQSNTDIDTVPERVVLMKSGFVYVIWDDPERYGNPVYRSMADALKHTPWYSQANMATFSDGNYQ